MPLLIFRNVLALSEHVEAGCAELSDSAAECKHETMDSCEGLFEEALGHLAGAGTTTPTLSLSVMSQQGSSLRHSPKEVASSSSLGHKPVAGVHLLDPAATTPLEPPADNVEHGIMADKETNTE